MTPFKPSWIPRLLALAGLIVIGACNIFNPSGTGDTTEGSADDYIQSGQEALRSLRFVDAFHDFSTALAIDSGKSLAWHGLAKASLGKDSFNLADVVDIADTLSKMADSAKLDYLVGLGPDRLTNLYRPLMRVASIYNRFRVRDSLGKTDHVFSSGLVLTELSTIYNNKSYFGLIDVNADTVIKPGELAGLKLMSLAAGGGGIKLDADKLLSQGKMDSTTGAIDSTTRNNINGIFNNVKTISQDSNLLNKLIGNQSTGGTSSGTSGAKYTDSLNSQAKSFIQKLGASTNFFLINDSLDNDGDGCLNEEVFGDSLDNDGDGLKDDDGRVGIRSKSPVAAGVLAELTPRDGFRHDAWQIVDSLGTEVLRVIPTTNDPINHPELPLDDDLQSLTYAGSNAVTQLFKGLRWVSPSDSSEGVRNDTIWTRVLAQEGKPNLKPGEDKYEEVKTLAIIEVRKKVLAVNDARNRVLLGRKIVGGCWDNVKL